MRNADNAAVELENALHSLPLAVRASESGSDVSTWKLQVGGQLKIGRAAYYRRPAAYHQISLGLVRALLQIFLLDFPAYVRRTTKFDVSKLNRFSYQMATFESQERPASVGEAEIKMPLFGTRTVRRLMREEIAGPNRGLMECGASLATTGSGLKKVLPFIRLNAAVFKKMIPKN